MSVISRWTSRLNTRRRLEAAAKADHTAAQRALTSARQRDVHPRQHLVDARDRESRRLRLRRQQIAYAERVLARHRRRRLTRRDRAVQYALRHAGRVTEQPAGSNRGGIITVWQRALGDWLVGQAWCGVFCAACLNAAGLNVSYRLAAVSLIEDDARGGRAPFTAWTSNPASARPGDLAVLFGRGVHVEIVVRVDQARRTIHTVGGNTSSGTHGSQSNGGGCYRRARPFSAVHGIARVNYHT